MLLRRRYGRLGYVALPYLWIWELCAPVIELGGLITIGVAAGMGELSREFFVQFLIFGYAFATMISIGSVLLEEITFKRYNRWKDMALLICFCFVEHFPYRQLHLVWRLQGMVQYWRGDVTWKTVARSGFGPQKA